MKASITVLLLFLALEISLGKPWDNPTPDKPKKWDDADRLEELSTKSRDEIHKINGSLTLIRKMQTKMSNETYAAQMKAILERTSRWAGCAVTEAELDNMMNFFTTHARLSWADQAKAFFAIGNILLGAGVVVLSIAALALMVCYCEDIYRRTPDEMKVFFVYLLAVGLLLFAYYKATVTRSFLGCLGAIILGLAYLYHLVTLRISGSDAFGIFFFPPVVVWGFLALLFDSYVIGFITVLALGGGLMWSQPNDDLCRQYRSDKDLILPLAPAAILLILYGLYGGGALAFLGPYAEPFVPSLFLVGGFVYFAILLCISSTYSNFENYLGANMMLVLSTLLIAALGFGVSGLAILRPLAFLVTVIYLVVKYTEIPWGKCWSSGLLGGGILLFGVGVCLLTYWKYLFPETSL